MSEVVLKHIDNFFQLKSPILVVSPYVCYNC